MISHRLPALAAALCLGVVGATSAVAGEFTDSAGRIVVLPPQINRAMAADRTAEVLIDVLAPDKLAGWTRPRPHGALPMRHAPRAVVGPVLGPAPAAAAATVARLRPDVVIDVGPVTPARAAFADQVSQASRVPYILLDGSFDRMPSILRVAGRLLGVAERADDIAGSAEHAISAVRGRLLIQPATQRPRVYYARGPNGLETALPGSEAGAAIDAAGAINVAGALGPGERALVTPQQLRAWNPDLILVEDPMAYGTIQRSPLWATLPAVRNKKVFLEPSQPFGWIDDPPGVNRVIGLYWLSQLFYPNGAQEDVRTLMTDLYDKLYGIKLSEKQVEAIAKTAGIPASDTPHLAALPPLGAGPLGKGAAGAVPGAVNEPGRRGPMAPLTMPTTPSYAMPK
jgi:iron complex transport system substrate-binding protein